MLGRERYYVDEGRGHDDLLRCKDCGTLVTFAVITRIGCCPGTPEMACGNKRFSEVTLLNDREMADIQSGLIDFPNRDLFLAEFAPLDPDAPKPAALPDPIEEYMADADLTKPRVN